MKGADTRAELCFTDSNNAQLKPGFITSGVVTRSHLRLLQLSSEKRL